MSSKAAILQCGRLGEGWALSVRSSKAFELRKGASSFISSVPAKYRFFGISDKTVCIADKIYQLESDGLEHSGSLKCVGGAVFFDNTHYNISIHLPEAEDAYLFSPLATWCDSADWDPETCRLIIPVNFGNDLGDFELCWEWVSADGERHNGSMSAQVFSSKLDIYSHFQWMLKDVTEQFRWIQLDLLRQTTWGWSHDSDVDADLNTWLLIFQRVRNDMEDRMRKLTEQHRRRLVPEPRMLRAEQMRKISPRLEERVAEGIKYNPGRRYTVEKKTLDADTPENRYMKHILFQTHVALNDVIERIEPVERISDIFKDRLKEWSDDWAKLKQSRFWKGIGSFHGLRKESLVLSQDPLYAGIRRSWYQLQQGLQFLDQDLRGGIQNAAQLYEIWCLVKIVQLLEQKGWFCLEEPESGFEQDNDDFGAEEIRSGAVKFEYYKAGLEQVQLDLLFQPTAGRKPKDNIWSGMVAVPVEQRPDIVLRLHRNDLPNKPIYTWIFDAKYRLKGNNAPDDAVNQMHRYRDAILWSGQAHGLEALNLTRESIGAFVLYPGDEKSEDKFPQLSSIDKTNIGAFPLRPTGTVNDEPRFLSEKLQRLLDIKTDFQGVMEQQAEYYAAVPSVRQRPSGAIAVVTVRSYMNEEYWNSCRLYHLPNKEVVKIGEDPELYEYLAPQKIGKEHYGVFPILERKLLPRKSVKSVYRDKGIHIEDKPSWDNKEYWLFKLGKSINTPDNLRDLKSGSVIELDSM